MQYGFYFNGRRCTGCKTACWPQGSARSPSSLAFRQVYEYGGRILAAPARRHGDAGHLLLLRVGSLQPLRQSRLRARVPHRCMHKDERGLVSVDAARWHRLRLLRAVVPLSRAEGGSRRRRSVKCDGCTRSVAEGGAPVCVEACLARVGFRPHRRAAREVRRRGRRAAAARCHRHLPEPGAHAAGPRTGRPRSRAR